MVQTKNATKPVRQRAAKATEDTESAKATTSTRATKRTKATKDSKAAKSSSPLKPSKLSQTIKPSKPTTKQVVAQHALQQRGIGAGAEAFTLLTLDERQAVMEQLRAQNPNPKSELDYSNPFELICAVVLSAQATDVSVNQVTPKLFAKAPNAHALAQMTEAEIGEIIKTVGLWKNKAKNLVALGKVLDEQYAGVVPDSYDKLIELPGVGSKTAKVVLNVAYHQPYIAVDTHVFRVCNRIGLCLGQSPAMVEERLPPLIPEEFLAEAHHYLLLHGRYNCTAKKYEEHCPHCVVKKWCKTYQAAQSSADPVDGTA